MRWLPLLLTTVWLGCSSETDPGTVSDTGPRDTGVTADTAADTTTTDTGLALDSAASDTGVDDTGKADTGKADTGKTDTGTPPVEGGECGSDGECRAYDSYCATMDPCTCLALPAGVADPKCGGGTVTCFVAPCSGKKAACVGGTCVIVAK